MYLWLLSMLLPLLALMHAYFLIATCRKKQEEPDCMISVASTSRNSLGFDITQGPINIDHKRDQAPLSRRLLHAFGTMTDSLTQKQLVSVV